MSRILIVFGISVLTSLAASAMAADKTASSPADGYAIHVQAPHVMEDGTVGGPFHHYCKGISDTILQCLLFDSTDPNAKLVAVEYFVAKELSRKEIPLIMWHRHYHDHKVEIETGRVRVLEPADKAKEIAEAAAKTDGIIFHLWQKTDRIPTGHVCFPQSVGHDFPRKE